MKTSAFLTLTFSLFVLLGFSQKNISGVVQTEEGNPIPFAKIRVVKSQKGTITDVKGKFNIENIGKDSKWILVRALGYAEQEVSIDGYDIDLAMNLLRLKNGVSFNELKKRKIYHTETFIKKLEKGIESNLLEKSDIKATDIGYKFLNDTVNLFS